MAKLHFNTFILILLSTGCVDLEKKAYDKKMYELCVNVGTWYYKDHGMYPTMPNGDFVEFVVSGECKKNVHAYGEIKLKEGPAPASE
jgi:hypothetical protein